MGCGCGGGTGTNPSVVFQVTTPSGQVKVYNTAQEARAVVATTGGTVRAVKRVS
jgi:hypothetical protein